jgi:hypothetical protein
MDIEYDNSAYMFVFVIALGSLQSYERHEWLRNTFVRYNILFAREFDNMGSRNK